jgi:hypothetical protein
MGEISVEIDNENNEIKNNKIDVDIDKPHNGKQITMMEISYHEDYLVTYSPEDESIIGWNVTNEEQLKPDLGIKITDNEIQQICVSYDKKLAYKILAYIYDNKLSK